jgi:hypothetical protein
VDLIMAMLHGLQTDGRKGNLSPGGGGSLDLPGLSMAVRLEGGGIMIYDWRHFIIDIGLVAIILIQTWYYNSKK